jgi:hypothetical protein
MGHPRAWLAGAILITMTGCSTGGTASPAPDPTTPLPATAAPVTTAPVTVAPTPSATPAPDDPLVFFRSQEASCKQFAQQVGNAVVEPDRFSKAKVVRDLGNGATQIVDGRGTRLVVVPKRGIVLPESGRTDAAMPQPYEFGCSEKVFVGAAHD